MKIYNNEIGLVTDVGNFAKAEFAYELSENSVPSAKKLFASANTMYDIEKNTLVFAVLCSVGWNLNDDIFVPEDTFAAVKTPILKPVNLDHLGQEDHAKNNTFGVIIDSYPVNENLEVVSSAEEMRHVVIATLLWDHYFEDRVKTIEAKMKEGKQFVSMECHFNDFAYGLRKVHEDGKVEEETLVVPRNEETSRLTRFLRAYKGKGLVTVAGQKYKIGRVLKNQLFTGVAFVDRPANPESIVFPQKIRVKESMFVTASLNDFKVDEIQDECVLNTLDKGVIMAEVKQEVKETKAECGEDCMEECAKWKAEHAKMQEECAKMKAEHEAVAKDCAEAKKMADEYKAKAEKAESEAKATAEALAKMTEEVTAMKKKEVMASRASQLRSINQLTFVNEDEQKAVASLGEMSEEVWNVTFAAANKIFTAVKKAEQTVASAKTENKDEVKAEDIEKAKADEQANLATAAANTGKISTIQEAARDLFKRKAK
jgi:hypothetical protein